MFIQKIKTISILLIFIASVAGSNLILSGEVSAYRDIIFPVVGSARYINDYDHARGTRKHNAIDIIANKGQSLVAAVAGTITNVQYPQPSWGYSVTIRDDSGYRYTYIHMNDDRPGTNDGKGGGMNAYAADVKVGNRVDRGQLLGKVGDSGNSNGVSHLHFEMYLPNGTVTNPYYSLNHAKRIAKPVVPGVVTDEMLPYGPAFSGGANISMGNFDVDQASEFVVGAGKGGGPHVKAYQDNNTYIKGFFAYNSAFRGGVDVATGDIDGDGLDEIITGAGPAGGPQVKVFKTDGTYVQGFFAFEPTLRHGIQVAAGDVNGDLKDEIIVSLMAGGEPRVEVYDLATGTPTLIHDFLAYTTAFRGGVDVAAGDVSIATSFDEIVTSAGQSGHVKIFQGSSRVGGFFAYNDTKRGGIRVSVGNVRTSTLTAEILTVPSSSGPPQIQMFNSSGTLLSSRIFMEEWWIGGYDIGAGYDTSKVVTGTNRRVSVRPGID